MTTTLTTSELLAATEDQLQGDLMTIEVGRYHCMMLRTALVWCCRCDSLPKAVERVWIQHRTDMATCILGRRECVRLQIPREGLTDMLIFAAECELSWLTTAIVDGPCVVPADESP